MESTVSATIAATVFFTAAPALAALYLWLRHSGKK